MHVRATLALGLILLFGAGTTRAFSAEDPFGEKFDTLRRQSTARVGRQAIVEGYEALIASYPKDPRVPEVMLKIASLMENENRAIGMRADRATALKWYRKAADAAVPGTDTWVEAQFFVARRLRSHADQGSNAADARRILDEITENAPGNAKALAEVEHELFSLCVLERNFEEAEQRCLRLIHWYDDPSQVPQDENAKKYVDMLIAGSASALVQAWVSAPWPKDERVRRIQEFVDRYPSVGGLKHSGKLAVKIIQSHPDSYIPEVPDVAAQPGSIRGRLVLVVVNIVVLVIGAVVLVVRRIRKTKA